MTDRFRFLILGLTVVLVAVAVMSARAPKKSLNSENFAFGIDRLKTEGVPDFSLSEFSAFSSAQNFSFQLKSLKTKIILINFWATWCTPCVTEFPSLVALAKKYPDDLVVLAISQDEDRELLKTFLLSFLEVELKNFKVLVDDSGKTARSYGTVKIPETYLVDKDFKLIRKVIDTHNWESRDFVKFIEDQIKLNSNIGNI